MRKRILALVALGGLTALSACTNNSAAVEPKYTPTNVTTSELQFQVGTANLAGTLGLNTVVTFRQPNGLSALLDNTPTITLPFTNTAPASVAGTDSGTNHISGQAQTNNGVAGVATTFSQSVGAFAYGLLASNSTTSGANSSVFYPGSNSMPYYSTSRAAFYVGPGNSYVSNFNNGSLGTTFLGYPSGFTSFALTPTTGTYSLSVGLPNASTPIPTFTATTTMTSVTMLPTMPMPTVTSTTDGAGHATGGLVVNEAVPAGVSETLIFIQNGNTGLYYTLVMRGSGSQTATLAANLGVVTGGVAAPTFTPGTGGVVGTGDPYTAYAVGFDYPAIEAVPIGANPPQAPVINNAGTACSSSGTSSTCPGQADMTESVPASGME